MIRYNEVSITTWISRDFKELSPNGKLLWLYILTGPIRMPVPGIYKAGVGTCTDDLAWSSDICKKAFNELEDRGMVKTDWISNVIYLPSWNKYNRPPANPNVFKSWLGMLDSIPDCDLKMEFIESMRFMDQYEEMLENWLDDRKEKFDRPEIKKPVKKVIKVSEIYSDVAYRYLKAVKKTFPKLSIFKNGSVLPLMNIGAKEVERVCKLDNYKIKEVQEVLEWVVSSYDESQDFNWLSNLQSLRSLRKKGKNGNSKFDNIYNSYNGSMNKGKKKKREIDYSDANSPI